MYNRYNQPSLKLIEVMEPNLTQATLPALINFECTIKLPKTNKSYKRLHELVASKFASKVLNVAGGKNFTLASIRHLNEVKTTEVEQQICETTSNIANLRYFGLEYFPRNVASEFLEVERVEPILSLDEKSPLKYNCLFRLVSKPYLIKEHLGKEDYSELFHYTQQSRAKAFQEGKAVKFDKLKVVPIWVKIKEAQVI